MTGALDTPVTLTFDLLTSGLVHAEVLPWTTSTDFGADSSSLSFLQRGQKQTDRQTRLNSEHLTARWRPYSRRG